MSTPLPPEDARLLTRLNRHPQLRGRIERLVDLVEDVGDDLRTADDAERRVIEEVRRLGQEVLGNWADGQVAKRAEELERTPGVWREGKKNSVGTARSATSKSTNHNTGRGRGGGVPLRRVPR
jgi:hypothetical protein